MSRPSSVIGMILGAILLAIGLFLVAAAAAGHFALAPWILAGTVTLLGLGILIKTTVEIAKEK